MNSSKSKVVALVLCIFGGFLGLHRFYVGKKVSGILYLLTGGVFGIGWIYDIFEIIGNRFTDSAGLPIATGAVSTKPAFKKWQFWVAIVIYLVIIISPSNANQNKSTTNDIDSSNKSLSSDFIETKEEPVEADNLTSTDSVIETNSAVNTDTETENKMESDTSKDKREEYDALQKIFLGLNKDFTINDLLNAIKENNLPYASTKYTPRDHDDNTLYVVALDEKAAQITHVFTNDSLRIDFDTESGLIRYGVYYNHETSGTSLYYEHGSYIDFSFTESSNPYTGYYYNEKHSYSLPKTKVVYSNGNSKISKYSRCDSAENALNGITVGKDFDPIGVQSEVESRYEEKSIESTAPHQKYEVSATPATYEYVFIINTDSNIIHKSTCAKGQEVLSDHRLELTVQATSQYEAIQYVISQGYSPCGICMK